jgi:hypothetical protein
MGERFISHPNKGNIMKTRMMFVVVILAMLLTACAAKTSDALIGKWRNSNQAGYVEFANNNVYNVVTPTGESFSGTYKFTDKNTVEVSVEPERGGTYSVGVSVSGDTLTFTAGDGTTATLTRIK